MKIKLEFLNLLTGFALLAVGVIDLVDAQYIRAASWIIFGSMYLVMDSYKKDQNCKTWFERFIVYTRNIFGWVGFIGSILLLVYRLWT